MNGILKSISSGYFYSLFLLLLFASVSIAPVSAETIVSIVPFDQSVTPGSDVTVVVYIEPDTPISGAQFDLSFDTEILSVVSVSEGDIFTHGASTLFHGGVIDNSAGTLMNVYNLPLGKNEVSMPGTLATIVFDVNKVFSSSSLQLSNVVVSNSNGFAVPISVANGMVSMLVPVADANVPYAGDEGSSITFDGSASFDPDGSIVSYDWDFGDGTAGVGELTSHTYSSPNIYVVTLEVTDNNGLIGTDTSTVSVKEASNVPQEVFYDSFEQGEWNGLWDEGSRRDWFDSTQRSTGGIYSAEVDGSASDSTLTSKFIDLDGRTSATVTFSWYIESSLDSGEYLAFDVSKDGGSTWTEKAILRGNVDLENTWHEESIDVTDINSLMIQFRGKMSRYNEDANVDEVRVMMLATDSISVPVADFSYAQDELSVQFTDMSTSSDGITGWKWEFGDGVSNTDQNPVHTYSGSGTYVVDLIVYEADGDSNRIVNEVTVVQNQPPVDRDQPLMDQNQAPLANANGPYVGDEGSSITFDGSASFDPDGSIALYEWNFGDGITGVGGITSHTYSSPNTYVVTLRVTDNNGLIGTDTSTVSVKEASNVPQEVFYDSFEQGEWNGLWDEGSRRDWFDSTQRSTGGIYSAEVDGSASDSTLTSKFIDLDGRTSATVTFSWYIESSLDSGEYLAFDVSKDGGSTWTEKAILRGNVDLENTWHEESIDVTDINSLMIQFRGKMSRYNEDANVDEVRVLIK
ncbi:PKD domain-containing protein [Methanococcoides sp. SA1]|nr:PKD domain-containing protein [Methanococcoides sp. SA1]